MSPRRALASIVVLSSLLVIAALLWLRASAGGRPESDARSSVTGVAGGGGGSTAASRDGARGADDEGARTRARARARRGAAALARQVAMGPAGDDEGDEDGDSREGVGAGEGGEAPEGDREDDRPPQPEITLIERGSAGASGFDNLRFRAPEGTPQTLVFELRVALHAGAGASDGPTLKLPVARLTTELVLGDETGAGERHGELGFVDWMVLEEPGQIVAVARSLRASFPLLADVRGYLLFDERGVVREGDFDVPAALERSRELKGVLDGLREAFPQLTVPLPEEPVGVGARWSVATTVRRPDGTSIDQTKRYTLEAREGDELTLRFEITQTAGPQATRGAGVRLESLAATGEGRVRVRLDEMFPRSLKMTQKTELRMSAGGSPFALGMDVELGVTRPGSRS